MPWLSEERIKTARKVDLLTYLQEREPHELISLRSAPGEYRTVSHGSLVISNGAWYWNRGQFGGRTALDYLVRIRGMSLVDAVLAVEGAGCARASPDASSLAVKDSKASHQDKFLTLPPRANYPARVLAYLQERGINADVIRRCIDDDSLYEGRYNGETVCVFVGRDDNGQARFGCVRGIGSELKRDCSGSDKRFSFHLSPNCVECGTLVVTESPIDALSHLCLSSGMDAYRLSLGGTSDVALISFLERRPQIKYISLCLDADGAGQTAAPKIKEALENYKRFSHIAVTIDPPDKGKDFNEALLYAFRREREQQRAGHRKDAGLFI